MNNKSDRGVSPVMAVVLLVAVSVGMSAMIGTFALDLGESTTSNSPQQSAGLSTTFTDGSVTAQVVTGSADKVTILVNGTEAGNITDASAGDTVSASVSPGDDVTIVTVEDGEKTVSSSTTAPESTSSTTVSSSISWAEDFEDAAFSDTFDDVSQSCVSPNITSAYHESGSYALDLASEPGTCTSNRVETNSSFEPSSGTTYTVYLNKYTDAGAYNKWRIQLADSESDSYAAVTGTGYNNEGVDFEEYNGTTHTVDRDVTSELSGTAWHKVVIMVVNESAINVTVNGATTTHPTTIDWTNKSSHLYLSANAWGNGDDLDVAYDNTSIEE